MTTKPDANTVTISKADHDALMSGYGLLKRLNENPEARRDLERSMKKINPSLETEEDVAARLAAPYVERIAAAEATAAAAQKRIDDAEAAAQAARDQAATAGELGKLDAMGYTDEGKAAIQAIMVNEKIPNAEAAALLFDKRNPKPVEIPGGNYESDAWNLRGDPDDKNTAALFANEDAWADREAAITINTMRKQSAVAAAA